MKKVLFLGVFATSMLVSSNVKAQAVEQGNVIVDVYYGFPNLYTSVFKALYASADTDSKVSGIGPLGLRGEYMVADKFGIGLDLGFNNTKIVDPYTVTNGSTTTTYEATYATKKIGAIATFNYHFLDNDKVDAYAVFGIGYGNRTFTDESTEPGYVPFVSVGSFIPVASKIGVGMRYFFTDNIGANLALGFGQGGVINAGISAKF